MFEGFSERSFDFLFELSVNNDRRWFQPRKAEFEEVLNRPMKALANETLALMQAAFPEYNFMLHTSRIYRDARRLFGRGPYHEHMWFSIQSGVDKARGPRFWFVIHPEGYSHGLGDWTGTPAFLEAFRKKIVAHPARFEEILRTIPDPKQAMLRGDTYKRPKGHISETIDPWYNRRLLDLEYETHFGKEIYTDRVPELLAGSYTRLLPLFDFLFEAYRLAQEAED